MRYILAIDQSTQGTKLLLIDELGNITDKLFKEHQQIINELGYISHDMNEIYNNIILGVSELIVKSNIKKEEILAVGITNQRETTVAFDSNGIPLDLAVVWQCNRSKDIIKTLSEVDKDYIKSVTGIYPSCYYPASKMAWLLKHNQFQTKDIHLSTVDSYLIYRLTKGEKFVTDYTNASRTQLFDISTLKWNQRLCDIFQIPISYLPEVVDCNADFGKTSFDGLFNQAIPIRACLGDSHAALFGQGCMEEGSLKATYGTGSSILLNTGRNLMRSDYGLSTSIGFSFNHQITYVLEGNINYSGAIISWLKNDLKMINSVDEIPDLIQSANQEDQALLIPAFTGLGAPYWNPSAKAMLINMTRTTTKAEIVKASLESIAFQIYDIIDCMKKDFHKKIKNLKVDGGPTRNTYLMQFQADILQSDIFVCHINELSALGAAYMAGISIGLYDKSIVKRNQYKKYFFTDNHKHKVEMWKHIMNIYKKF
ncbi:MAG: glycerol kinase GlpK [Roseburia sp.]|nr:glycerol kinase GlpK [Anaeroplasma bactoclasticum]MCM1196139.1 glycerol kinase GlpK [Roseburia sp.]MCM1557136.1 glycerol kinase GlpK [Anaeroplasma bactoclasticum]